MYARFPKTAGRHGAVAVMGGLDYRASPDWGAKLGDSREGLEEMQLRSIEFLRDIAKPFTGRLAGVLFAGIVGPRGDAYALDRTMTASEAEDYHAVQMATLARARVDLVSAMTFNAVPEAVGVARAAAGARLPLAVYFTLDGAGRLPSGPSLREAIEAVDTQTGDARPGFYGINCSHPLELEPALEPGDWIRRVRGLRPNAVRMEKVQLCRIGHLEDGDPEELGAQMGDLALRHPTSTSGADAAGPGTCTSTPSPGTSARRGGRPEPADRVGGPCTARPPRPHRQVNWKTSLPAMPLQRNWSIRSGFRCSARCRRYGATARPSGVNWASSERRL